MGTLTQDMQRVVREQRLGYVATVSPDGKLHFSSKGATIVWDDDHLIFAGVPSPQTIDNLRTHQVMDLNVVDVVSRKGYRFKGTGEVLSSGPIFDQFMAMDRGKDAQDTPDDPLGPVESVVLVTVERAVPLISPDYEEDISVPPVEDEWRRYWAQQQRERKATKSPRLDW